MMKIKTIEGFGLPGAGKSTSINRLQNLNKNPSVKVLLRKEGETKILDKIDVFSNRGLNTIYRNFIVFYYVIVRPRYFYSVLKSIFLFNFNKSFIAVLRNLIEAQYCYSKFSKQNTKNNIVLD